MTILRKTFTPEYNPSHMHGIIYIHKSCWKVLVAQRVSDLTYAVQITHILSDRRCFFYACAFVHRSDTYARQKSYHLFVCLDVPLGSRDILL